MVDIFNVYWRIESCLDSQIYVLLEEGISYQEIIEALERYSDYLHDEMMAEREKDKTKLGEFEESG